MTDRDAIEAALECFADASYSEARARECAGLLRAQLAKPVPCTKCGSLLYDSVDKRLGSCHSPCNPGCKPVANPLWIECATQMPEDGQDLLFFHDGRQYVGCFYLKPAPHFWSEGSTLFWCYSGGTTHWRPSLPPPEVKP